MTIQQILDTKTVDELEKMSDAELAALLGPLIPKAREPDKAVLADQTMELAERARKMLGL